MGKIDKFINKNHKLIILILLTAFVMQSVSYIMTKSSNADEFFHIASGYSKLKTGDYRMNTEQTPLLNIIEGFPLLFVNPKLPLDDFGWQQKNMTRFGDQFYYVYNDNADLLIELGRIPILLLSLILGFYVFLWAKDAYGMNGGLFALFLYSFEPNIIAHSSVATTDMGFAVFAFISVYYFYKYVNENSWKNLMLTSIFFGFAQASKFTAVFLIPIFGLFGLIVIFFKKDYRSSIRFWLQKRLRNDFIKRAYNIIISIAIIFLIGLFIINLTYLFQGTGTPLRQSFDNDPFINKEAYSADQLFSSPLLNLASSLPSPLPYYYVKGFGFVMSESKKSSNVFLHGRISEKGFWQYYLIAMLVKMPIPLLIFLIASIILLITTSKIRIDESFWIIFILFFFVLFSFFNSKQIGLRYIIQIFPFIFLLASKTITSELLKKRLPAITFLVFCLWMALSTLSITPNHLAYYNELVGPSNGYKWFADSNTEWIGENVRAIRDYVNTNNIRNPYIYEATIELDRTVPHRAIPCKETKGTVIVNAGYLQTNSCYSWLKKHIHIERINYNIFVYKIT